MATDYVRVGGIWQPINPGNGIYANVGGTWRPVAESYANVGGVWQPSYIRDIIGPAAPTNVLFAWTAGGYTISWTNPGDADYAGMNISVLPMSEVARNYQVPAFGTALVDSTYSASYYNVWTAYLTPYDQVGNPGVTSVVYSMGHTGRPRGRLPSPWVIDVTGGEAWFIANNALTPSVVSLTQCYFGRYSGTQENEYIGMFYYGDLFYSYLRGANITGASLQIFLAIQLGYLGINPQIVFAPNILDTGNVPSSFALSGADFIDNSFTSLGGAKTVGPSMTQGNGYTVPMTLAQAQTFAIYSGSRPKSIMLFDGTYKGGNHTYCMIDDNVHQPRSSPVVPGRVTIAHDG